MSDERRRYARKPVQDRAVLRRQAEPNAVHSTLYCTTVDISPTGLQLKLKQALEKGERVDVVIHVPGQKESFHLRGEARWSASARDEKMYHLGIEIDTRDGASRDLTLWRKLFG